MAQHDYDVNSSDAITGLQFRQDVNACFAAVKSTNTGATEPVTPISGMLWFDNSSNPAVLKQRNSTNNAWNVIAIEDIMQTVASASTTTIGAYANGKVVHVTGSTTITSLGQSNTGTIRYVIFDNALTITHNATSLILAGNANITTQSGDAAIFLCENGTSGYWRMLNYFPTMISVSELRYLDGLTSNIQAQLTSLNNSVGTVSENAINAAQSELNAAASANYVGNWVITTPYVLGQSVSRNGFLYRCSISNTGKDPTIPSAYWVEISPLLKTLLETLFPDGDAAYKLGTAGEIGFGVATAPYKDYTSAGMVPLEGHTMPLSPNYGNYLHIASGSVMVYIPKHYYKIDGNTFYFSDSALDGYVLDRSFINAGVEKNGIFVMKYGASNNNGVYASIALRAPISTATTNNPQSALLNTPSNTLGGCYKAVKSMDVKAFLTPIYVYAMLARLAYAHGKAATTTTACAFITVNPRLPKGNNNNALKDINDVNLTFTSAGNATYPACALTGSGSNFAKTTHNGQACGVADLNGNMWETSSGFIRKDVEGFMVLKESVDISSLTDDGTGATGAYNVALYNVLDVSSIIDVIGTSYFGNGTNPVFEFATDRTSAAYKRTSIGLPLATGVSGAGATDFGNDGLYKNFINDLAPFCGGNWSNSSGAGVFAMSVSYTRTFSGYAVGSRASLYAL